MKNLDQIELLKDLGTFWYSDTSVPQLFERKVLDNFIKGNTELPNSPELEKMIEDIQFIFSSLKTVKKESETCSKIIEPLLDVLGYYESNGKKRKPLFDEQRALKEDDSTLIPDYTLFENFENHIRANELPEDLYFENVNLIIEAKRVGRDLLSKTSSSKSLDDRASDSLTSLSPLSQIRKYVRAANSEYGIVTNGDDWILIAKTSRNYLSTYHIRISDLIQLSKAVEDPNLILYWWLPFSKFFLLNENGRRSKAVRTETIHFTTSLETDLKKRLTPVVLDLMNETIAKSKNLKYLLANKETLILEVVRFIYQVLYIGCLEDRNLLPLNNPEYLYKYSLRELFNQLMGKGSVNLNVGNGYYIYDYLAKLMKYISSGSSYLEKKNSIAEFSIKQTQFEIPLSLKLGDAALKDILLRILRFDESSTKQVSLRALDTIQFGNIYEHILRLEVSVTPNNKFEIISDDDKKYERSTAVYTPHHIVEQMVADIVERYSIITWQDVENLKIVDPCFGSGHFLIELARQFSQKIIDSIPVEELPLLNIRNATISEKRQIVQRYLLVNSIYGVDRSGACIDVAKFSIWLSTAMIGQPPLYLDLQLGVGSSLYGETNIERVSRIDLMLMKELAKIRQSIRSKFLKEGAGKKFNEELVLNLDKIEEIKESFTDDFSLLNYGYDMTENERMDVAFRQRPFFWLKEFPEVFLNGGFTVYATNPPYDQIKKSPSTLKFIPGESELYRLAKMTDLDIKDYTNLFDTDLYYKEYQSGFKNLFEGFLLLKDKILADGGFYSLIVPNSILAGEQTRLIRGNIWSDNPLIIREYPEKDAVSKRVFKLRKVACSIIFVQKLQNKRNQDIVFEVYNDANVNTPSLSGNISRQSSKAVDLENLPFIILDDWQSTIMGRISEFALLNLKKEWVREGELNEGFNKEKIKDAPSKNVVEIFGTNRMEFFYFNCFPKQDIIQYCNLQQVNISRAKFSDYKTQRLAVNGIAGTNDTRVLSAVVIEPRTLLNSNVNYLVESKIAELGVTPHYISSLFNSVLLDKVIRVQKKTNHNSSAMISSLPIFAIGKNLLHDDFEFDSTPNISQLVVCEKDGKRFSKPFYRWLNRASKILSLIGESKNRIIEDMSDSISSLVPLNINELNSLLRKFDSNTIDPKDILVILGLRGKDAVTFRSYIETRLNDIVELKVLEDNVLYQMNFLLCLSVLGDEKSACRLLVDYKITKPKEWLSIRKLEKDIETFKLKKTS